MTRQYQRHNKEELTKAVMESDSFAEVCRKLSRKPVGGTVTNIKLLCRRWGISTNHMTGQAWKRGKRALNRSSPDQRLIMGSPIDHRVCASKLRRVLLEIDIPHVCNCCGINRWNDQPLVLEIDHIDGQYWNNQRENLQFLCPNCHSQKPMRG